MLNRLKKRITKAKNIWKLSKKSGEMKQIIERLSKEDLNALPDEDTKATFLSYGTEEEYQDYVKKEVQGWKVIDEKVDKILNGKL